MQSPPIFRAMVTEALQSWVIPTVSVASRPAVLAAFRRRPLFRTGRRRRRRWRAARAHDVRFVSSLPVRRRLPSPPGVACVCPRLEPAPLHDVLPIQLPRLSGRYAVRSRVGDEGVSLPAGMLALVVDGRFVSQQGQGNRIGRYRLEVAPDRGRRSVIDGNFEDSFAHQRLGRRGSTVVEVQHTSQRHVKWLATPAKLRVQDIDPSLEPRLGVAVYPAVGSWLWPILKVYPAFTHGRSRF